MNKRGFTIIELMVSLAIFSAILLVILTAITQVSRIYYKGVITSQTQEYARKLLEAIAQDIQTTSSEPIISTGDNNVRPPIPSRAAEYLCIGASRYLIAANRPASNTQAAVWRFTNTASSSECLPNLAAAPLSNKGSVTYSGGEFLGQNMRVLRLQITKASDAFTIKIRIAYGTDDLLEAPDRSAISDLNYADALCKGSQIGSQFCAVSELQTTVTRRVR